MPSTLVHAALAGILAAALLGRAFGWRSLALVVGAVVLVDFDVFVGMVVIGAHRAAFHTLLWPVLGSALLVVDDWALDRSLLERRFGGNAPRVAAVTLVAVVVAAIGPDLMTNGANLLYPIHDQFYALNGHLQLSNQRGIVQTFFEKPTRGSSEQVQYYTGADPDPSQAGAETDQNVERTFMVVNSGLQLLLVATGVLTVSVRLWDVRRANATSRASDEGGNDAARETVEAE